MGGSATSPLRSQGSPNKGTKSKVPHKWAELLYHPCVLGGPQTRGQSQRCPTSGQNFYITPAFCGGPHTRGQSQRCPQVGRISTSPLRLGGPQTRGQSQRCPTNGQNCYITPAFLGVPKQGDKVKGGPQVGTIATSPLHSRGSPNKGTKSKVTGKWAKLLYHPCVSGVPKQGDKVKGAPQVGGIATSPLRSRGSPNKGTKSKVPHKSAQLPHHPCVLGGPITPACRGSPNKGTKSKVAGKWAEFLYHPCVSGVPKQGDKVKGGPQVGGIARHQGSPSKLEFHCNLLVPIISAITSCNAFR